MKAQQNIHQQLSTAKRAINIWSDSLRGDLILYGNVNGFTYNNEPKQTKTGI